ncbi:Proteophosphoglycan 5 [Brachionus plicatilis]|uniref:Proteophosphoglycan 5 n=1 Tax=Brachionus plicatilis TaxID=10195 RepID=A0A3M7P6I7_BRAPC|nr:Proteophosphoglycan 5 [Brachionus plicatilis]
MNKTSQLNLSATFYVTKDVWALMKMLEKSRNREYIERYKTKQYQIDPEKRKHSPELYAVWNIKHFMGKLVSQMNPYNSDFFIYTDIGGWRSKKFSNWPYVDFAKNVSLYLNDTCLYNQVYSGSIGGGFIAGSRAAFDQVSSKFYEIHDKWFDKDIFVGKDQNIMNSLAFREYPKFVMRLRTWGHACLKSYTRWFFYEWFFQYNPNCSFSLKSSILKSK